MIVTHYAPGQSTRDGRLPAVFITRCTSATLAHRYANEPEPVDCPDCRRNVGSLDLATYHIHVFLDPTEAA